MVVIYMLILLPAHEYKAATFVLYAEPRTNVGMFKLERRNKARVDVIVPYVRTFGEGAKSEMKSMTYRPALEQRSDFKLKQAGGDALMH